MTGNSLIMPVNINELNYLLKIHKLDECIKILTIHCLQDNVTHQ